MPSYTFTGPGERLHLGSKVTLIRGVSKELSGDAAARAERHPRVRSSGSRSDATPQVSRGNPGALAARRAMVARAKELGIPATGKNAELAAAIAAAEEAAS